MDGVAATRKLVAKHPEVHVLVPTTYDTDEELLPATEACATSYFLEDAPVDVLLRATREAARGIAELSLATTRHLLE